MLIHVEFDVILPTEATDDEITEWLRFETREDGRGIQTVNPLSAWELEAAWQTLKWRKG